MYFSRLARMSRVVGQSPNTCILITRTSRSGANRRVSQNKSPLFGLVKSQIPTFQSDAVLSQQFRYFVSDSYGSDVLAFTVELPQMPNGVSSGDNLILLPYKAVRIKSIEMWCNFRPEGNITGNTINLTMIERRTVRPIEWSDTATFLKPAHIKKTFSKLEPLGLWYATTSGESNPEIRFQLPKGAIMQITYDAILHDGESCGTSSGSSLSYPKVYTNQLNANVTVVGKTYQTVISA